MLRKQAQPAELAALLKIKEVREILDLHKANPKESSERINQYQKDLAARLRSHDRGKRQADEQTPSPDDVPDAAGTKKSRTDQEAAAPGPTEGKEVAVPKPARAKKLLTGILSQSELALPPTSVPKTTEFNVQWIQYFFQLMCSKTPFFSDRKLLVPGPSRTYIEESEDQRIYVDGLSSSEIVLLLNFVFDMELNLKSNSKSSLLVPNKFAFLPTMGDPLESGLLDVWYYSNQSQCATCALRYGNRKLLTIHHDYHYHKYTAGQRRKRGLENNFRGWMESPQEFLGSKEIQFGFEMYKKLDEPNAFLGVLEPVVLADGDQAMPDQPVLTPSMGGSHEARTMTATQQLAESILPDSVPVDEIKTKCLECGEAFDKQWIGEPVDMAVYQGVIALPVGGSVPLQFHWPIKAKEQIELDENEFEESEKVEEYKVEAAQALFDYRFINSILLHNNCFLSNPRLKDKAHQLRLLSAKGGPDDPLARLRPPREEETATVIEEVIEEDMNAEGEGDVLMV